MVGKGKGKGKGKDTKKMYSIDNLNGTYDDLTVWVNELLKSDKQEITRYELISYLNSKGRVPLAIMKKNKPPPQPRCIARILKDHSQCKNESESDPNNHFCKIHNIRPAKYTINHSIDFIEQQIEQIKLSKKQQKEKQKLPKSTKKIPKTPKSPKSPKPIDLDFNSEPEPKNLNELEDNYVDNYEDIDFGDV
jgi:hypothetical protein